MLKKIGGNWHKVDVWDKEGCIVGYKSGGLIFISLLDKSEIRYIPFYNFRDFKIINNLLVIIDNFHNTFYLKNINSEIEKGNSVIQKGSTINNYKNLKTIDDIRAISESDGLIVCAYKQKGIDIFSKKNRNKIFHYEFPGYSFIDDIKYYNKQIYVADVFGLRIININNFDLPILDDSMVYKGWPKDIAVNKNYIFVADVLGIKIFDKNNNFSLVGKFETNKNRIAKVVVKGNLAFLACEARGLRILDISNLHSPDLVSGLLLPKGIWDVFEYKGYIYCAAYTKGVYKIDYSNLKDLKLVSRFSNSKEIIGVYVNTQAVFVSSSYDGITILDHDLNLIKEIKIKTGRCWATIVFKNLLISACGKAGVLIYKIDNLSNPVFVIRISTIEARDVVMNNDLLYIADGQNGIEIYNLKDFSKPKYVCNIPSAAFTRGVMIDERYIYKADGDGGLEIFSISYS